MATTHTTNSRKPKRRLPLLVRHAITLAAVFVIALPLSYIVGQRLIRHQQLQKLDSPDPQVFESGLQYVYSHAPDEQSVRKAAVRRINTLPPERATELLWALGQSYRNNDEQVPILVIGAGRSLIDRVDFTQKFVVYDRLVQLGVGENQIVLNSLHRVLDDPDDRRFIQAVEFYDAKFLWLRESVPADAWLRWAVLLSHSTAPQSQLRAANLLGDFPDRVNAPDLAAGLARLAQSDNPTVRGKTLDVAAGYAMLADDPVPYEQVLITLTTDENETLARRAWITLGLINPLSGFSADWRSVKPTIAEAMLWAVVKTNPDHLLPAFDAMETDGYRAAGTLALCQRRRQFAGVQQEDVAIKAIVDAGPEADEVALWRAILVSRDYDNGEFTAIEPYLVRPSATAAQPHLHFAGRWVSGRIFPPDDLEAPYFEQRLLAYLEGLLHHAYIGQRVDMFEVDPNWPTIARLAGGLLKSDESPTLYRDVFAAYTSPARDLAVYAAAESADTLGFINESLRSRQTEAVLAAAILAGMTKSTPVLIEGLATESTNDLSAEELRAMTDAQLADLGLKPVDALTTLLDIAETAPDHEDRYEQIALLKLALWMRGDLGDDFIPEAEAMLEDDRLPTSTVLMCLLHMHRPAALYYLFDNPAGAGDTQLDLYDLFVTQRWWHVFSRLVPDPDLDLWLWGDPGAQSFQFEVMRQWVQVNRWRLEAGWWPGGPEAE
ncbi:hypothetical protein OT109_18035 [Phycisphaeraceae bacterium D3-23]